MPSEMMDSDETQSREYASLSVERATAIISVLTGPTLASSLSTGLLTVTIPKMAIDLGLDEALILWPASVYSLTCGCTLLLAGSVADLVGSRLIFFVGYFFNAIFMLSCGLARSGAQLIVFRGFQGVAVACCLPTAVSILTRAFPRGRTRNIGFASMGAGQPLGFSVGLVLGGFFVDSIGWRFPYYLFAGVNLLILGIGFWSLPMDRPRGQISWQRLLRKIDWVGALLASTSLGMLSYVFAVITQRASRLKEPSNIVLLAVALAVIPVFIGWVARQERLRKPALIPNSLWKNMAFTTICTMVLLSWAVLNTVEWLQSLYFQKVQVLSAFQTSLRFLPNVILGAIMNIATGLLVHRVPANYLVLITSLMSAAAPLLMSLIHPQWPYWYAEFWAVLLGPLSVDVLFTVSNLIISNVFPDATQSLAGAVFNTVAQFGNSLGLAIMADISSAASQRSKYAVKGSPEALLVGYRLVFWVTFGAMLFTCLIGGVGLRKAGKVGLKRD